MASRLLEWALVEVRGRCQQLTETDIKKPIFRAVVGVLFPCRLLQVRPARKTEFPNRKDYIIATYSNKGAATLSIGGLIPKYNERGPRIIPQIFTE